MKAIANSRDIESLINEDQSKIFCRVHVPVNFRHLSVQLKSVSLWAILVAFYVKTPRLVRTSVCRLVGLSDIPRNTNASMVSYITASTHLKYTYYLVGKNLSSCNKIVFIGVKIYTN